MADENILALAPARSDDQILPFAAWNTNFFRAFISSASVPAIYIQQFWNTLTYEAKTGAYSFQLDETRFVLDANPLRDALEITPIDQAYQFGSPPLGDAIMNFVNQLGYTEIIHFVSRMATQIPSSLDDLGPTKKGRKDKPHVISYYQFTKLIICHLGRIHNVHQRSTSPFNLAKEDLRLGNLKFVPKGEVNKVFGMPIPNELISNNIKNATYYKAYLEMVAKHDQKVAAEKEGKKKTTSAKTPKSKPAIEKSSKPVPTPKPNATKERPSKASIAKLPKPKLAKEKSTKTTPPLKANKGEGDEDDMELAIQMSLESFQTQSQEHVKGVAIREPVAEATRLILMVEGKGKAIATEEQATHSLLALHTPKRRSTTDQFVLQRRTPVTEEASTGPSAQAQDDTTINIIRDSPSPAEKTDELDQGQARSDPGRTLESRPPPEQVVMDEDQAGSDPEKTCWALAGPDPEPMHNDFMADLYPNV
nr:histone deacetylase 14 [Tanacetum cinerariifolium]